MAENIHAMARAAKAAYDKAPQEFADWESIAKAVVAEYFEDANEDGIAEARHRLARAAEVEEKHRIERKNESDELLQAFNACSSVLESAKPETRARVLRALAAIYGVGR